MIRLKNFKLNFKSNSNLDIFNCEKIEFVHRSEFYKISGLYKNYYTTKVSENSVSLYKMESKLLRPFHDYFSTPMHLKRYVTQYSTWNIRNISSFEILEGGFDGKPFYGENNKIPINTDFDFSLFRVINESIKK